ncbi:methionyl-tRNA formyltransferase [Byssothecium circinans]|uniref:methionyl-tRNA formyltransferase n=1 Tax=Byssothecium circinans TaxID=147558 RepID=A0A6A5UG73_9PLEO|nr:methionyl-tRNA formyltransferase [Byssothecium circinans]
MIWRLPVPVRSFYVSNCRRYSTVRSSDPLRILFCGSDEFSIASLRKLVQAKQDVPDLIKSIDVVHRPGKPTGRKLLKIKEVPIKQVTEELQLDTHVIDTFTGWTPPISYNLIIAVSFGLFVPPRILNLAKYQGLNVHPSLLPDLKGAAPLHHTILKKRPFAGVTVQTLHPEKIDSGTILAQSPSPGIDYSDTPTITELTNRLGNVGGDMLVDVLKSGAFVPPVRDVGWYAESGGPVEHAGKLDKSSWFVDFSKTTLDEIETMKRAGGLPWCAMPSSERLVLNKCWPSTLKTTDRVPPGIWCPDLKHPFCNHKAIPKRWLMAKTAEGGILRIQTSTSEGSKTNGGYDRFRKLFGPQHVYVWEKDEPEPRYGKKQIPPK